MMIGSFVRSKETIDLDPSDKMNSCGVNCLEWLQNETGLVVDIEYDLPEGFVETQRLIKVLIRQGIGWCYLGEVEIL
jgi:hypothetical protein